MVKHSSLKLKAKTSKLFTSLYPVSFLLPLLLKGENAFERETLNHRLTLLGVGVGVGWVAGRAEANFVIFKACCRVASSAPSPSPSLSMSILFVERKPTYLKI